MDERVMLGADCCSAEGPEFKLLKKMIMKTEKRFKLLKIMIVKTEKRFKLLKIMIVKMEKRFKMVKKMIGKKVLELKRENF